MRVAPASTRSAYDFNFQPLKNRVMRSQVEKFPSLLSYSVLNRIIESLKRNRPPTGYFTNYPLPLAGPRILIQVGA
jgi:hypothetical protein